MDLQSKGITLPPVAQVGVVVKDLQKTVEHYESILGVGPWAFRELHRTDAKLRGQISPYRVRTAKANLGPVEIELIQILEGETTQTEFLREKGEGVHHLGFLVANLDEEIAKFEKAGIGVLQTHRLGEGGFAYMDTEAIGGMIVELIQRPPAQ